MQNIFKLNNPKLAGLAQVASRKYICSHKTSCRLYMKIQTFLIIIGINAANALSPGLQAQTCRVTAGYTADGQRNYIEVFELTMSTRSQSFPVEALACLAISMSIAVIPPAPMQAAWREGSRVLSWSIPTGRSATSRSCEALSLRSTKKPSESLRVCPTGLRERCRDSRCPSE